MTNAARIARVHLKKTGQTIEIIKHHKTEEPMQALLDAASHHAHHYRNDPKALYMLISIGSDGSYLGNWHLSNFPFGSLLAGDAIKDLITREIHMTAEIKHFCRNKGWIDS